MIGSSSIHFFIITSAILSACSSPQNEKEKSKPEQDSETVWINAHLQKRDSINDIQPLLWYVWHHPEGSLADSCLSLLDQYIPAGYADHLELIEKMIHREDTSYMVVELVHSTHDYFEDIKIKERNHIAISINSQNQVMMEDQIIDHPMLISQIRPYILGNLDDYAFPECRDTTFRFTTWKRICPCIFWVEAYPIPDTGDRASFAEIIYTARTVVQSIEHIRKEKAATFFNKSHRLLDTEELNELRSIYPIRIHMYLFSPIPDSIYPGIE